MDIKTMRNILKNTFGSRKYMINNKGEIHVYGSIPNTSQIGWYLYGFVGHFETECYLNNLK